MDYHIDIIALGCILEIKNSILVPTKQKKNKVTGQIGIPPFT